MSVLYAGSRFILSLSWIFTGRSNCVMSCIVRLQKHILVIYQCYASSIQSNMNLFKLFRAQILVASPFVISLNNNPTKHVFSASFDR